MAVSWSFFMDNFKLLREQIKKKLQNLSVESRVVSSQKISQEIIDSEVFIRSQNIACYIPTEHEVDSWTIIKSIWEQGKNCYLPACGLGDQYRLCFVKFVAGDKLVSATRFKVLFPEIVPEKLIAPEALDLAIVPLLGFTQTGFRLGRGAGCYDRTFAFKKEQPLSSPYLLGVGYKCQQIDFVPRLWDVAMDEIIGR